MRLAPHFKDTLPIPMQLNAAVSVAGNIGVPVVLVFSSSFFSI